MRKRYCTCPVMLPRSISHTATLKQFFASELTVGNFKYIDDDEFSTILSDLQDEFHLSAKKIEKRIKERIESDYSKQKREKYAKLDAEVMNGFLEYQINKHGIVAFTPILSTECVTTHSVDAKRYAVSTGLKSGGFLMFILNALLFITISL